MHLELQRVDGEKRSAHKNENIECSTTLVKIGLFDIRVPFFMLYIAA